MSDLENGLIYGYLEYFVHQWELHYLIVVVFSTSDTMTCTV